MTSRMSCAKKHNDNGIALVTTLLLLTLLGAATLPLALLARLQTRIGAFEVRRQQAHALAWSALQAALLNLPASGPFAYPQAAEGQTADAWLLDSTVTLPETTGGFLVRITDEAGKLPLGKANESMLTALPGVRAEVAAAILDWIDSDDDVRSGGAESREYADYAYKPRNGRPPTVAELGLVMGVTPDLLWGEDTNGNASLDAGEDTNGDGVLAAGLVDWVTTADVAKVNINTAPPAVLQALPGMTPDLVDEIVEHRNSEPFSRLADVQALSSYSAQNSAVLDWIAFGGGPWRLQITAWPASGKPRVNAEAVVAQSGNGGTVLYWRVF